MEDCKHVWVMVREVSDMFGTRRFKCACGWWGWGNSSNPAKARAYKAPVTNEEVQAWLDKKTGGLSLSSPLGSGVSGHMGPGMQRSGLGRSGLRPGDLT